MTDASHLEAELCNCSICTTKNTPFGACQSRSTRALHQKADKTRQDLQRSTLVTVLDIREDDCSMENPLWRGRRTSPIDAAPVQLKKKTVLANGNSETLATLLNEVKTYKSKYSFPSALIFVHPPITPTDMYPEGGWSYGPAAIHSTIAGNASTLLYINYLQNIRNEINKLIARPKDKQQVLDLLCGEQSRLEVFRKTQWMKQQGLTPDPWGLRTNTGVSPYNTG